MNHDPIAPALNDPPLRSSDELSARHNHVDYSGNTADIEHTSQHSEDADATDGTNILYDRTTSSAVPAAIKPWGERFAAKRKAALDTLFNTLDSLVYLELVVLYCFECVPPSVPSYHLVPPHLGLYFARLQSVPYRVKLHS